MIGYEQQKKLLCWNTEKFLAGLPANNVLLYGSSGTGKSTMIKALLKQYQSRPLRMIEIHRDSMHNLHQLAEILSQYNLKFILFIDDLSFEDYETEYKGLKAMLEGSLQTQTGNVLIYATSNRRHLVKEYFHDREHLDDEIHVHDTQQEKISLADRFGLTLSFASPGQVEYLAIVAGLAERQKVDIDAELLRRQALQWERSKHGPSGRTAQQFINHIAGQSGADS
ncbi:MAG: ATP-binding protein [Syntrophomonadaceae bacterium]